MPIDAITYDAVRRDVGHEIRVLDIQCRESDVNFIVATTIYHVRKILRRLHDEAQAKPQPRTRSSSKRSPKARRGPRSRP